MTQEPLRTIQSINARVINVLTVFLLPRNIGCTSVLPCFWMVYKSSKVSNRTRGMHELHCNKYTFHVRTMISMQKTTSFDVNQSPKCYTVATPLRCLRLNWRFVSRLCSSGLVAFPWESRHHRLGHVLIQPKYDSIPQGSTRYLNDISNLTVLGSQWKKKRTVVQYVLFFHEYIVRKCCCSQHEAPFYIDISVAYIISYISCIFYIKSNIFIIMTEYNDIAPEVTTLPFLTWFLNGCSK